MGMRGQVSAFAKFSPSAEEDAQLVSSDVDEGKTARMHRSIHCRPVAVEDKGRSVEKYILHSSYELFTARTVRTPPRDVQHFMLPTHPGQSHRQTRLPCNLAHILP